jgi:pyruvate formate lyase activating enzyme
MQPAISAHTVQGRYLHRLEDDRIQCDLCPRYCRLRDGQHGLCFVRAREGDNLVMRSWGRSSGFCRDPIEKKPLFHFLPGSSVLSFGTAGCNLACKYCQNWHISKARRTDALAADARPEDIAGAALDDGCRSVAYTYNDPVVFLEYAVDTAHACREAGLMNVAVTAGYICAQPREEFFAVMDAANVDLKAFTERFYWKLCGGHLEPVKETLEYLVHETDVWVEITTLIIPGENDSPREIEALSGWVANALGPHVPLHLTAFHPAWRMQDYPGTPATTLHETRAIARENGLRFVYTGNIHDPPGQTTWCAGCGEPVIRRAEHQVSEMTLDPGGRCRGCGSSCPGVFEGIGEHPGPAA